MVNRTRGGDDESEAPLPRPTASFVSSDGLGPMTEDKVRGIICNPIYAGLGPFPRMISDAEWVRSAATAIDEDGAEQFLVNLLNVLRKTFPADQDDG